MRAGKMDDDLAAFLAPLTAFAEESGYLARGHHAFGVLSDR